MARRRFFVDQVRSGRAVLEGDNARHLRNVLRVEPGEVYEISDNASVYLSEIEMVRNDRVSFRILEKLAIEDQAVQITLLLALVKFDRFEWALEKVTELGVARVVPVSTARAEKGLDCAALKRFERWRRVVRESSQQARRWRMPELSPPMRFEDAVLAPGPARFFLDEDDGLPLLAAAEHSAEIAREPVLLVGPEGGWTDAEREKAAEEGWTAVSLGPTVLRSETAAIAAVAVLSNAWLAYAGDRS